MPGSCYIVWYNKRLTNMWSVSHYFKTYPWHPWKRIINSTTYCNQNLCHKIRRMNNIYNRLRSKGKSIFFFNNCLTFGYRIIWSHSKERLSDILKTFSLREVFWKSLRKPQIKNLVHSGANKYKSFRFDPLDHLVIYQENQFRCEENVQRVQ